MILCGNQMKTKKANQNKKKEVTMNAWKGFEIFSRSND